MNIVFFTGAGISVPSGLPTYRGKDGIYTKNPHLPQKLTYHNWCMDPDSVLEATAQMKELTDQVHPNRAHFEIAGLESRHDVVVITQNVDGLHKRAGSTIVHELHGSLYETKTDRIGTRSTAVLFGENLPANTWDAAEKAVANCEVFIAVGTSGDVVPAAYLMDQANERAFKRKCKFMYLAMDEPERDIPFAEKIMGSAEVTVPKICSLL